MRLRRVILCCVAIELLAGTAARAEDRWLFVPVFDTLALQSVSTAELTAPFERAFSDAVANAAAATLFEASAMEPKELTGDELAARTADLESALRLLAAGHRAKGERELRAILALGVAQRDYFRRAPERAQKLFQACVFVAHSLAREQNETAATQKMVECVRDYPGFQLSTHAPEVQTLFERARSELAREPTGELSVQSGERSGCVVRLDGLPLGVTPLTLKALPIGPVSVQVECDAGLLGRVHVVDIEPRQTTITIDPRFDDAVSARGGLSLRYGTTTERMRLAAEAGAELGRELQISHVVLLLVSRQDERTTVSPQRLPAAPLESINYSGGAYDAVALQHAIAKLKAMPPSAAAPHVLVPAQLETEPDDDAEVASEIPARRQLEPPDDVPRMAIAIAMSGLGVASIATSWALYASRQAFRLQYRTRIDPDVHEHFAALGRWSVAPAILGSVVLVGAEFVWVPETRASIPVWAWLGGAAGLTVAAVGVGFAAGGTHCVPIALAPGARIDRTCLSRTSDGIFGWNVALDALPLLALPLAFATRGWLAPADMQLSVAGPGLSLSGRF